jgi:phosphate acyltransferase
LNFTVALDANGGDHGSSVVLPAALRVLSDDSDVRLVLVGDQDSLRSLVSETPYASGDRLKIRHASQRVEMDDPPAVALRNKKDSSMRVALNLVKSGEADACVSAGNTGALMAMAKFVLKTLPGIDRPAIVSALPTITGHTNLLDLGANVESSPAQLFQFAVMGSVLAKAVDNIASPRVGLLNVGQEEIKGNERVKETGRLLAGTPINYIGFVEGDDIYKGTADVIVCDGFVGNIALKSSEGLAQMISFFMRKEFNRNIFTRIAGLISLPVLKAFRSRIDPRRYNGATLVGLRGIVVKSHGGADALAFATAIRKAVEEVKKGVPERISEELETMLTAREAV